MKERITSTQCVEQKKSWKWQGLLTAALAWALFLWAPAEWFTQNVSKADEGAKVAEVTQPTTESASTKMISLASAMQEFMEEEIKKPKIDVHGMIRWGSDVTPLLWTKLSNEPAIILSIDVSNPQTWLWATLIRADDFNKSMDNPASQATIMDLYWQKQFWNASIMVDWEYVSLDKLPGSDSFTPIVWCTYDVWKWWNLDAWACHTFQKWDDVDIIRLWVTKNLDKGLSLAAQAFYSSNLSKKFYGRVQANVKLGGWLWVQLSFIAKNWEITPTAWIQYNF